jgi:hypothetical protein
LEFDVSVDGLPLLNFLTFIPRQIIRNFQESGAVEGKLKEEGEVRSVFTQADLDAQAKIIG